MGRQVLRGLLLIGILLLVGYGLEELHLSQLMEKSWIDSNIKYHGFTGELMLFAVGSLYTALGLPRQVLSFFSGYAFGIVAGTLLALAATAAGCVIAYYAAHILGRKLVSRLFPRKLQKLERIVGTHPLRMTLLIRLLPVGSNLATNIAAGVSYIHPLAFFAGSTIGYLPQTLIFALLGNGIKVDPLFQIGTGVVLFLISAIIGVSLSRRFRNDLRMTQ